MSKLGSCGTSISPPTVGPITSTVDSLDSNLSHLHDLLDKAESIFGPVTRVALEQNSAINGNEPGECDLHSQLMRLNDRLNGAIARVNSLNQRCAL